MPYMNSITDEAGIDIEVVVTVAPGETVGMMEGTEEIKVGEFTATLPYELATGRGALRERSVYAWNGSGGRNRDWFWWCGTDL